MDEFKKELKEAKNPWIKKIGKYLLTRDDMAENLKKTNKSLKECFDYILQELSKTAVREGNIGYAAGEDEEIYALAIHYYDEDDIKVEKKNFICNADDPNAYKKLNQSSNKNNHTTAKKTKKIVHQKEKTIENQMSLFDLMGDENV